VRGPFLRERPAVNGGIYVPGSVDGFERSSRATPTAPVLAVELSYDLVERLVGIAPKTVVVTGVAEALRTGACRDRLAFRERRGLGVDAGRVLEAALPRAGGSPSFSARRASRYLAIFLFEMFLCSAQTIPNTGAAAFRQLGTGQSWRGAFSWGRARMTAPGAAMTALGGRPLPRRGGAPRLVRTEVRTCSKTRASMSPWESGVRCDS
jgi:hypothetical protein